MATEDDDAESLLAAIDDDLVQALIDEVHQTISDMIDRTRSWIEIGAPTHPSRPGPRDPRHPSTHLRKIPNETLVLAYGEAAAMYGDATRRMADHRGVQKLTASYHRDILGDVAKLFEQEVARRLENK